MKISTKQFIHLINESNTADIIRNIKSKFPLFKLKLHPHQPPSNDEIYYISDDEELRISDMKEYGIYIAYDTNIDEQFNTNNMSQIYSFLEKIYNKHYDKE